MTAQGFGAPPVYTIVQYLVSELDFTGICMKMAVKKNIAVKKQNLRLRFACGRCVPGACCRRRPLQLSPPPPPMAVDDVRLRMRKRDWLCNGTHQRQQKQAQGNHPNLWQAEGNPWPFSLSVPRRDLLSIAGPRNGPQRDDNVLPRNTLSYLGCHYLAQLKKEVGPNPNGSYC